MASHCALFLVRFWRALALSFRPIREKGALRHRPSKSSPRGSERVFTLRMPTSVFSSLLLSSPISRKSQHPYRIRYQLAFTNQTAWTSLILCMTATLQGIVFWQLAQMSTSGHLPLLLDLWMTSLVSHFTSMSFQESTKVQKLPQMAMRDLW
jgi:hypothetical protein